MKRMLSAIDMFLPVLEEQTSEGSGLVLCLVLYLPRQVEQSKE